MLKRGDTVYLKGTVLDIDLTEDLPVLVQFQDVPQPLRDYFHPCVLVTNPYNEGVTTMKKDAYNEGITEMKDVVITISVMEPSERVEVFGFEDIHDILLQFELDELNKKLEAHQVEKIHKMLLSGLSDIKIGDIVVMKDNCKEYAGEKFIVFDIVAPEGAEECPRLRNLAQLKLMDADGRFVFAYPAFVEKTKDKVNMDKVFGILRK